MKIRLAAAALAAAFPAHAATIETSAGNGGSGRFDYDRFITVTGDIVAGDSARLEKALQGSHHATVSLISNGGLAIEGVEMGRAIVSSGAKTYVDKDETCASACAFAWLAGNPRIAGLHAQILFHHVTDPRNDRDSEDQGNAVIGGYLGSLGINAEAIAFMTEKGPDDVNQLTPVVAAAYGIQVFFDKREGAVRMRHAAGANPPRRQPIRPPRR